MSAPPRLLGPGRTLQLALGLGGLLAATAANSLEAAADTGGAAASAAAVAHAEQEANQVFKWIMIQRENPKRWSAAPSAEASTAKAAAHSAAKPTSAGTPRRYSK